MCDPVSIGVAAISAGVSLYGSMQQANAAKAQQQAIADQNRAELQAQNQGFTQRIQAAQQQTEAQTAAMQETISARSQAENQMRQAQMSAMKNYQDVLDAENQQATALRQTGDTAAQQLVDATNAQNLAKAQADQAAQTQTAAQVGVPTTPTGPGPTDPSGNTNAVTNDLAQGGALARRTAEAATNIRNYGAKIAALQGYSAPIEQVGLATADTKYGIMPAEAADQLLRGGSPTRLLPTQVAYQGAGNLGQAQDALLQSKGQSALDAAGLSYGNAVDLANLQQSNADTIASNIEKQKQADAAAQAAQGKIISGIGQLGLYGAGYLSGGGLGGAPSGWAAGTGAGEGIYTNLATGATTDLPGVSLPGIGGAIKTGVGLVNNRLSNIF